MDLATSKLGNMISSAESSLTFDGLNQMETWNSMAEPAPKILKEVGKGDFNVIFQCQGTQLISCHLSLKIFADFWDLGGTSPPSPPCGPATVGIFKFQHFLLSQLFT